MDVAAFQESLEARGWAITTPVVDAATVTLLRDVVAPFSREGRGGARNLLDNPHIRALATSRTLREFACAVLGDACFAVRALLFDKTPAANWKVIWHQDLTIATCRRADVPGYGPWTEKSGVPHVQPPLEVLESMVAVRLHLDPCGAENGPVRVIDGTHRLGRLSAETIDALRAQRRETECHAAEGALLVFRPLLLHASAPAMRPAHRRVIHIEYAAHSLTEPLAWHQHVA